MLSQTNHDSAFNLRQIKRVHWLALLQHHEVSDINHRIDRADTTTTQFFLHPEWRLRLNIHVLHDTTKVTRTRRWRFHVN
ncbi:Uncharacterised protein [Vibrio cholerae]|nr:Uncharacterised protein [Vibrio cholerae]